MSSYLRTQMTHSPGKASADSIISNEQNKKPNFFIRFLRRLALPSKSELKKFNWKAVEAQFDLLDNYDECQKDVYTVDSHELIEPIDCPYRIRGFMHDLSEYELHDPHRIPADVRSFYSSEELINDDTQKKNLPSTEHHGIPLEDMTEEQLNDLLEDLFSEIPNDQIAWEKLSPELEDILEEALHTKWKDIDFTPELSKINNLLRKKLNKQIRMEENKEVDFSEYNFSEDESMDSLEDVDVFYDADDLHGISDGNLTDDDDANWSDIDDVQPDVFAKMEDPEFISDLEKMFPVQYRGDCERDQDFIEVVSDTSSLFEEIDDIQFGQVKEELENIFAKLPEFIEITNDASDFFGENPIFGNEGYIETTSDVEDLFGDRFGEDIEIHSDESSLYDTSSDDDDWNRESRVTSRQPTARSVGTVKSKKTNLQLEKNEIQITPQLELTDMELKDLIRFRFKQKKAVPMASAGDSLTPLENEIECLVQIAAEIRGYGKHSDDDYEEEVHLKPIEENPKIDGPAYAWADIVVDGKEDEKITLEFDNIDTVPSHYSLELNFPVTRVLHPSVKYDEIKRFKQPREIEDYALGSRSQQKLNKMLKARQVHHHPAQGENKRLRKCRHHFYHKTSVGKVLRKNLRYNHISYHFPKLCRRCKVPLVKSLVPYITPLSMIFCCILPCLSYPCYSANKEYRCIVCQEVYLLGDFKPSSSGPTEIEKEQRRRYRDLLEQKRILRRKYSNPRY